MKLLGSPSPRPSPRGGERGVVLAIFLFAFASGLSAQEKAQVATLEFVEGIVELSGVDGGWVRAVEGSPFRLGDQLRTGDGALAYLMFPWMTLQIGSSTEFEVPDSLVLSAVLKRGRMEPLGTGGGIIKLVTEEAQIRGDGRIVVRRDEGVTMLTVRAGTFQVTTGSGRVALGEGRGLRIDSSGASASGLELAEAPIELSPAEDPAYALPAQPVALRWSANSPAYYVEVLPIHSEQVVRAFDADQPPIDLSIPWVGTFRWRVSARDSNGVEGQPSTEGLITVVER